MIRLRDLPPDFELNPGQFDHVATSDAVAALAATVKRLPEGVTLTLIPRGQCYNACKFVFSKGDKHVRLIIPDVTEDHRNFFEYRRDLRNALESLK